MNDCAIIDSLIDDYLDDRLDSQARGAFEQHIADCPTCRELLAGEQRLTKDLASLGAAADRIAVAPEAQAEVHTKSGARWRIAAAVAVFAAIGYGTFQVLNSGGSRFVTVDSSGNMNHLPAPHTGVGEVVDHEATHVSLDDGEDRMMVRVESDDPRIHVFWLYDVVKPEESVQ